MRMPWGKHRGEDIEDIDSGYLMWLAKNCEQDEIATAADEEYRWRTDNNAHKWED